MREGSIEGGRLWDGNLKLIPTLLEYSRESGCDAKMENILSEFQHFAFYLWRPGGWPLLRMGWDEWMRVKSCVGMNICIKSSSPDPSRAVLTNVPSAAWRA